MSKKTIIVSGIVVLGVVVGVVAWSGGRKPTQPPPLPALPSLPVASPGTAIHADAAPPPVRLARPEQPRDPHEMAYKDESSLMAKLRELRTDDLELSLKLAREGNERFPHSPDAIERTWFVCKSLTGLGRSAEARAEALKMVEKYPDSSWTRDVQRHVIYAPSPYPTE